MDTIEKQIATAEGRITELQLAFVDNANDPDKRRRTADQLATLRARLAELYLRQATQAA
ncbi:ABC transporter C-terminal domain-containing protein [Kitasatospora sp. NPDC057692]|uniref:ABC transporter C-terminal domain-containing protein n=1 Tax=Kitasatospora sp. NPDC057692 TaxID=3346215 RepID=UPI00368EFA19